jgi:hypothetical protein
MGVRGQAGETVGTIGEVTSNRGTYSPPLDRVDSDWLHLIDLEETGPDDTAEAPHPEDRFVAAATLVDAFVESFVAHDLEGLMVTLAPDADLPGLGEDVDGLPGALGRCWNERPHAVLTRGLMDGEIGGEDRSPVAVLWDVDDDGWRRVGLLTFELDDAGERLGCVEFVGDVPLVDEVDAVPPDEGPPEGALWREWDEGADGG